MQETIKGETPGGKKVKIKNQIVKYAGLGLVFGITASLGFCAIKPWAESRFQKDPEEVTISLEEEQKVVEEEEQIVVDQVLTIDNYRELNRALVHVAEEAEKSMVDISAEAEEPQWKAVNYNEKNAVSGVLLADNRQELLVFAKSSVVEEGLDLRATFADGKSYSAYLKAKDENLGFAVLAIEKQKTADCSTVFAGIKPSVRWP